MSFTMTGMNAPLIPDEAKEAVDILYDAAQWAWTGGEDAQSILEGMWLPLGNNCNKWLGEMQNRCVPVFGKMDPEEINEMWDYLYGMHGDDAYKIFAPSGSNPLEDGVGLYVIYENEEAQEEGQKIMPEYGLSAPIVPEMVTPMGLYLDTFQTTEWCSRPYSNIIKKPLGTMLGSKFHVWGPCKALKIHMR